MNREGFHGHLYNLRPNPPGPALSLARSPVTATDLCGNARVSTTGMAGSG